MSVTTVSIITVCLNSEATIRETLSSVSSQSYPLIEHIFIDGKSSDNTLTIVEEYRDSVSCVVSEKDDGIYDAMNKGLDIAKGDIIYFLNSDDYLCDKDVIADVIKEFERDADIELIYGNVFYKYGDNVTIRRRYSRITRKNLIYCDLCHQVVFARRELFDKCGIFDTKYHIAADYDWLLKVFISGKKIKYINRDIAIFSAEGEHSLDLEYSRQERMSIKLNYQTRLRYMIGNTLYRGVRKLRSVLDI